jgi:hypothetical protein
MLRGVPALSILQVAVQGKATRERVAGKVAQITTAPGRLLREVGLVLSRARPQTTHGACLVEGSASEVRMDEIVGLEGTRRAPMVHADDGVSVITILALGPGQLWLMNDVESAVSAISSVADGQVGRALVHFAPADGQSFDPARVTDGYPHLAPLGGAATQTKCRFCSVSFEAYRTTCPGCGGAVAR